MLKAIFIVDHISTLLICQYNLKRIFAENYQLIN